METKVKPDADPKRSQFKILYNKQSL